MSWSPGNATQQILQNFLHRFYCRARDLWVCEGRRVMVSFERTKEVEVGGDFPYNQGKCLAQTITDQKKDVVSVRQAGFQVSQLLQLKKGKSC